MRKADGIFGQWTYDAVKAYQKDHGLAVDGIAGKNTQNFPVRNQLLRKHPIGTEGFFERKLM